MHFGRDVSEAGVRFQGTCDWKRVSFGSPSINLNLKNDKDSWTNLEGSACVCQGPCLALHWYDLCFMSINMGPEMLANSAKPLQLILYKVCSWVTEKTEH